MFSGSSEYLEDIDYICNFDIDWSMFSGKNVLIAGATGLIGTVLVDALMYKNSKDSLGVNVLALSRDEVKLKSHFDTYASSTLFHSLEADVLKPIELNVAVDYIVNLASNTHPALYATKPIQTIDSIVLGTRNILELAAINESCRVVNSSSVEVYGENRGDVERFTEDYCGYIDCNTLRAGYTEGKRLSESLCQAYISERNVDVVSARLGRVYGAPVLATDTKASTQFIYNAVNDEDIILKSKGNQEYSYVYVADAVTAILLLLTRGRNGEAYNISDDEIKTFRETAEILASINGRDVKFETPNQVESKGFSVVAKALMNSDKIKNLGWSSRYQLKDGLTRTVSILRGGG